MNLQGKKLLILGGIRPMCGVVEEAKKLGIIVYVTDYLEDSPAKRIADKSFMVSATDIDGLVELCKRESIDGVFTGYVDSLLPYCFELCQRMNFPFWGNEKNINNCIDKYLFKIACEKANVPVVPWKKVSKDDYKEYINLVEYPIIIKPVDNSGSRGVFKCYSKEEYLDLCNQAFEFSKKKELLLEKMMDIDNEFSMYYMTYQGKAYFSHCGDRYVVQKDIEVAPLGQGMSFPSKHTQLMLNKLHKKVELFFKQNEMLNGFIFLQGFYDRGELYIHEIGYRLPGGLPYKFVEAVSGYNQVEELLKYSLLGKMDIAILKKSNPFFDINTVTLTITMQPGIISNIQGLEKINSVTGIIAFEQLHYLNETIHYHGATARVFAYVLCCIKDKKELENIIYTIKNHLVVEDEQGGNMLNELISVEDIKLYYQ